MKSSIAKLGLSSQLGLAFGLPVIGLATLTALAAINTQGVVRSVVLMTGGALLVAALILALWVAASVGGALSQATAVAQRLGRGNLTDMATLADMKDLPAAELVEQGAH